MKLIPNWQNKRLRCHFCGTTRSVKYTVKVFDPVVSNQTTDVCACNMCALKHGDTKIIKQYTVDVAYTGNSCIKKYINGKCVSEFIISDYNIPAYQDVLEADGFEKAYDVDEATAEVNKAYEEYQQALEWLEIAKKHALVKEGNND